MSWLVAWSARAERTWKSLPPRDAKIIAETAVAFAERREGQFKIASREPVISGVLYAGKFEMLVVIEVEVSTVRVLLLRRSQ